MIYSTFHFLCLHVLIQFNELIGFSDLESVLFGFIVHSLKGIHITTGYHLQILQGFYNLKSRRAAVLVQ